MDLQPDKVRTIVLTTCILHNLLRDSREPPSGGITLERMTIDDTESFGDHDEPAVRGTNQTMAIRNQFKHFVNTHPILYR